MSMVSGPQVMRQLSSESSEKARYSKVNAILSYELKQSWSNHYAAPLTIPLDTATVQANNKSKDIWVESED
jgi:hypothetical protein